MEKSQEFLGDKPFNLFFEINQVFFCYSEKKNDPDIKEIIVKFSFDFFFKEEQIAKETSKGKTKETKVYIKFRPGLREFLEEVL